MTDIYTAARQALEVLNDCGQLSPDDYRDLKNDSITALREALEQPAQEPVAWAAYWPNGSMRIWQQKPEGPEWHKDQFSPLYAHPVATAPHDPVAWLIDYENGEREVRFVAGTRGIKQTPLYTRPQQREWFGLTDEDYMKIYRRSIWDDTPEGWDYERAIEAALRERNT